jgi:hypothetical protein
MKCFQVLAGAAIVTAALCAVVTVADDKGDKPAAKSETQEQLFKRHQAIAQQPNPIGTILALDPPDCKMAGGRIEVMATAGVGVTEGKGGEYRFDLTVEVKDAGGEVVGLGQTRESLKAGATKAIIACGGKKFKPGKLAVTARLEVVKPDGKKAELASKTSTVIME